MTLNSSPAPRKPDRKTYMLLWVIAVLQGAEVLLSILKG